MTEDTDINAQPAEVPALVRRAQECVERFGMLPADSVVVVMVSGGADSTSLSRLLASGSLGELRSLSVLHVNHLLRGSAADEDEEFVRELARSLDIPCRVVRYDVAAFAAEQGLNLEDAGRQVRYRFAEEELDARCTLVGAPRPTGRIAVGHTMDDRVETFLMRVATGAGAGGFTSLRPVRGRIIRPLLGARRGEVTAYLDSLGHSWREDATNTDTSRLRAQVRHELKPLFEAINPNFAVTLSRSIDLLADEDALLAEMATAFAHDFVSTEAGSAEGVSGPAEVAFERAMMATLSRPMARRTIRTALIDAFPEASRLESAHVEALVDGLSDDSFARDLPEGLRAFSEYGRMVVSRAEDHRDFLAPVLLTVPGNTVFGDGSSILIEKADPADLSGGAATIVIDADKLTDSLVVDSVREGDRMRPLGMDGTRKLSDMFVDAKVPRRRRGMVPIVRDGDSIVWVAGIRMSDEHKVSESTRRAWRLTWTSVA